jgi:hypothetical protein
MSMSEYPDRAEISRMENQPAAMRTRNGCYLHPSPGRQDRAGQVDRSDRSSIRIQSRAFREPGYSSPVDPPTKMSLLSFRYHCLRVGIIKRREVCLVGTKGSLACAHNFGLLLFVPLLRGNKTSALTWG